MLKNPQQIIWFIVSWVAIHSEYLYTLDLSNFGERLLPHVT